jgi:hypothetical protein
MTKYGCNNRPPLKQAAIVQSGWVDKYIFFASRVPVMITIKDLMTKTCIYQRDKKDDPKCLGCKELEK